MRPTSHGSEDALAIYAELLAHFAHRFSDRCGVLEARGLGEDDFQRIEAEALGVLQAATAAGDTLTLGRFAWAIIGGRAGLEEDAEVSEPTTHASSTRRTADVAPKTVGSFAAESADHEAEPVDLADLMATLSSEVSRSR